MNFRESILKKKEYKVDIDDNDIDDINELLQKLNIDCVFMNNSRFYSKIARGIYKKVGRELTAMETVLLHHFIASNSKIIQIDSLIYYFEQLDIKFTNQDIHFYPKRSIDDYTERLRSNGTT